MAQTPARPDTNKPAAEPSTAVAAILATKPTTPAECVRAAKILVDLERVDLAKDFVKKVLDAKLDQQQLAELGEQLGAVVFLRLADQGELLPEAKQLADAVVGAVHAKLKDKERIIGLIRQLQDPSPEKRFEAVVGLRKAGNAAVGPLLSAMADPAREAEHANLRAALVEVGSCARGPLLGVLDANDPKFVVQAIQVLGAMKAPKINLYLLRPCLSKKSDPAVRAEAAMVLKRLTGRVPTQAEAVRLLAEAAKSSFAGPKPVDSAGDGKVGLWRWDAAKRQCTPLRCTPEGLARMMAARWAREAHALAPEDHEIGLLYVTAVLDAVGDDGNLDFPVFGEKWASIKAFDEVLEYAMAHERTRAATMAAGALGRRGKADELLYQGAKPASLVMAVQSPDRRLRMAALEAIVRLQPTKPFAGSSYVPKALSFFVGNRGFRRALVACPNLNEARELAGMLVAAGFQVDTVTNGGAALFQAVRSPDDELALIDVSIDHPVVEILLQQLRRDPRTASLRVGLIARAGRFDKAERLAERDPMAKAFARPHDDQAFRWQLDQLATLAPEAFVDFDERQRQAAQSLDLLAELTRASGQIYDLRQVENSVLAALYNPKLAIKAIAVLANLNSAKSQQALVNVAARFTLPLEVRTAAAVAFRQNTEKYGILLTTDEIRRQYRRYNESEEQDRATQRILGLILDCLEVSVPKK